MMERKTIISFVSAGLFLLSGFCALMGEELTDTKSIAFTKNVVVKKFKKGEVHAEPYTVREKDNLWKILVDGYGINNKQFYFYCRITKQINPDLKDVNKLVPHQVLLIPFKYISHLNIPDETMRKVLHSILSSNTSHLATETYTFSKGEHLAQVLRDMYNIPDELIFNEYLSLVRRLNPDLDDLNMVQPDQTIVLPSPEAYRLLPPVEKSAKVVAEEEQEGKDQMVEVQTPKEERKSGGSLKEGETQTGSVPENEVQMPPAGKPPVSADPRFKTLVRTIPEDKNAYMASMSSVAAIFQGELHRLGDISIPLMEESRITIDTSAFPILQLTSDKRLILDYGGELPTDLVDLVQLDPGNYEVVAVEKNESMRSVLDKLFDAAGYFSVDRSRNPLVLGDRVQFEISGDWIIYGDEFMQDVRVVNLLEAGDLPVNAQLKQSADTFGVDIIDVYMGRGREVPPVPPVSGAGTDPGEIPLIDVSGGRALVDSVLRLLGQEYREDYAVGLFRRKSEGYDIEIKADRYFEREGIRYLITFHPVSRKLMDMIAEQGDRILILPAEVDDPPGVIGDLLSTMGVNFESPRPAFIDTAGGKRRVTLFIPGILIKGEGRQDVLLTSSPLQGAVYRYLAGNGVRVFRMNTGGAG